MGENRADDEVLPPPMQPRAVADLITRLFEGYGAISMIANSVIEYKNAVVRSKASTSR
jgi:hypothetical protein